MSDEITGKARGGFARAEGLPPSKRREIAKKAAQARWSDHKIKRATHAGELTLGDRVLSCAVLEDGTRVLSQNGVGAALGRVKGGAYQVQGSVEEAGEKLPFFVAAGALRPFISEELLLVLTKPIPYQNMKGGGTASGIPATALPQICDVWLRAREAGVLNKPQKTVAQRAELLTRALAQVAIVALVDEATGYQAVRPKDALQAYLEQIIRKELAAWAKKFPDEFYENIYKLKGWAWPGMKRNRYSVVAHYTRDLVYQRIAPTLLEELEKKSPKNEKGQRKNKLHQWFTDDIGNPLLAQHLHSLIMFQRLALASGFGWIRYVKMVDQVLPKRGTTLELPFPADGETV